MSSKNKVVRYAKGIDHEKSTNEIILLKFRSKKIEVSHTKQYDNALPYLVNLSSTERIVLDFILIAMDQSNRIYNNRLTKSKLNSELVEAGVSKLTPQTINKAFSSLCSNLLLFKGYKTTRGFYYVNPYLFWKGSQQDRVIFIRRILEMPFMQTNNEIRRQLLNN